MKRRKDFLKTKETVSQSLDGTENVKTFHDPHLKEINDFVETGARLLDNLSAKSLEACLRLFEHDAALDVYYTILDFNPGSNDDDTVKESNAQLAQLNAWIATEVTCLAGWKNQGSLR